MEGTTIQLSEKQKELIQKLGVSLEQFGLTPAEARISGLLLVSGETQLTFDEIKDSLGLSKSAVSNAINKLLLLGHVEYVTKHGDRKRYFRNNIDRWSSKMIESFNQTVSLNNVFKEVLANRPGSTEDFNNHLKDLISFLDFLTKNVAALHEEWQKK